MLNYLNQPSAPIGEVMIGAAAVPTAQATRAQDAMAQQRGFRNYNEMLLWAQAQERGRQESAGTGAGVANRMPQSWGEAWDQVKSIHPKSMFEYITRKMQAATGDGQ